MFNNIMYISAITLTFISFQKDKNKTKKALLKAWKSFTNILPQFLSILLIIGLTLTIVSPEMISNMIGEKSGLFGMVISSVFGSITLMPSFVAFPLTAALYSSGAGTPQIVVFISTLLMVGLATIPIERKYFGTKSTYLRNALAFGLSFVIAIVMGGLL